MLSYAPGLLMKGRCCTLKIDIFIVGYRFVKS